MKKLSELRGYFNELKKRKKKSKVYKKYQLDGLLIAELLVDRQHKSLYIKLAKEIGGERLLSIAKIIAENKKIKNKGAYFMWTLKKENLIGKRLVKKNKNSRKHKFNNFLRNA